MPNRAPRKNSDSDKEGSHDSRLHTLLVIRSRLTIISHFIHGCTSHLGHALTPGRQEGKAEQKTIGPVLAKDSLTHDDLLMQHQWLES